MHRREITLALSMLFDQVITRWRRWRGLLRAEPRSSPSEDAAAEANPNPSLSAPGSFSFSFWSSFILVTKRKNDRRNQQGRLLDLFQSLESTVSGTEPHPAVLEGRIYAHYSCAPRSLRIIATLRMYLAMVPSIQARCPVILLRSIVP